MILRSFLRRRGTSITCEMKLDLDELTFTCILFMKTENVIRSLKYEIYV